MHHPPGTKVSTALGPSGQTLAAPPARSSAKVTVVMAAGAADDVKASLDHLLASTGGVAGLDVVVVETDRGAAAGATHGTPQVLVLPTEVPVDPVIAVNVGVEHAAGDIVVILTPDARPHEGWLPPLLALLAEQGTGAVGPLTQRGVGVVPSGAITDAAPLTSGVVMFGDATSVEVPTAASPAAEVDALAIGCVALSMATWQAHHGLDGRYSLPGLAFADLCFRLRGAGARIVVATTAVVDRAPSAPAPERDRLRFAEQWADVLAAHEAAPASGGRTPTDADRRSRPVGTASRRVPPARPHADSVLILGPTGLPSLAIDERNRRIRRSMEDTGRPLCDLTAGVRPGVVWLLSEDGVVEHIITARRTWPDALIVADVVLVDSERISRLSALSGITDFVDAERARNQERLWYRLADVVVASTRADQAALADLLPDSSVVVLDDEVTVGPPVRPEDRDGILWWADFSQPHNVDAAHWLCREVLPRVQWGRRKAGVVLAGPHAAPNLRTLLGNGVTITDGDDLAGLLPRLRVAACPLRCGSGAASRTAAAAGAGIPVVATSLGADAAGLRPGSTALVADDADTLARAILECQRDDDLWSRLSESAQAELGLRPSATRQTLARLFSA
ncbi:MAG: hypothetical protein NVS3B21_02810 [Acidimicrobiales bacterium]